MSTQHPVGTPWLLLVALLLPLAGCGELGGGNCGPEPVLPAGCTVISRGECPGQDHWRCTTETGTRCFTARGELEIACPGVIPDSGGADAGPVTDAR